MLFIFIMRRVFANLQQFKFSTRPIWATAQPHRPEAGVRQHITLIPGIGIGPEITSNTSLTIDSVIEVFDAANVPVNFDILKDFTFENMKQRQVL